MAGGFTPAYGRQWGWKDRSSKFGVCELPICTTKALAENKDVKEFYLGMSSEGRKSFRDMKSYRRHKRWV